MLSAKVWCGESGMGSQFELKNISGYRLELEGLLFPPFLISHDDEASVILGISLSNRLPPDRSI